MPKMLHTLILAAMSFEISAAQTVAKIYPGDSRYPTADVWAAFNKTLGGKLLTPGLNYTGEYETHRVRICTGYDQRNYWRDPVLVKSPWWGGFGCPDCPSRYATETCSLGNHPVVVVKAENAIDVSEAVRFASTHNLRLVVKNTGHDFLGRSIGYGSLSIWTYNIKGIEWIEQWKPTGKEDAEPQSVVRYGSGVQWTDIYREAYTHNKIVTGGTDGSVGAGGGWLMGGGHGIFTNRFGLGVDNLLEVEVVLPTGNVVIANTYSYPDLFWAIRGGGGSTFGILTKITMKTHPSELLNAIRLGVYTNSSGNEGFVKGMAYLMSVMPDFTDFGLTGHPILQKYRYNSLFTAPGKEVDEITTFITPHAEKLRTMGMSVTIQNIASNLNYYTISRNLALNAGIDNNREGGPAVMGSRLWGRKGLKDVKGLESTMRVLMEKGYICEPFNIGGGAVSSNRILNVSINPMWRDAVVHMSILPPNQQNITMVKEVEIAYRETTNDTIELLDRFSVGSAAYLNEASWEEPNWKSTLFGGNYERLLTVKRQYDPNNVLWCYPCVGSEAFWMGPDGKLYRNN